MAEISLACSAEQSPELVECFRHEGEGCLRCDGSGFRLLKHCEECGEPAGRPSEGGRALIGLKNARGKDQPMWCLHCHPEHQFIDRNEETPATGFQGRFFGERFRMLQCATCSAWARLDESDFDELRCGACGAVLSGSEGRVCVVPHAFRTDLKPRPKKEEGMSGSRHRSVQAEGRALSLEPWQFKGSRDDGFRAEARIAFDGQARTYRLNRGPKLGDEARGFEVSPGSQRVRLWPGHVWLPHQAVVDEDSLDDYRREGDEEVLWLAAPKTTDSLYISPSQLYDGLALHRLPARAEDPVPHRARRWQGVRAAALSATFLVVDRASLALDIDPTELEVLEPRPYGTDLRLPLIQITDELVNGAGFCRNLSEPEGGAPKILKMMHSMLSDPEAYPLKQLLHEDHRDCETACYRCLLRYGNQQFHGLLDWSLGLSYLRAVLDPGFACGLDGDFAYRGIDGWREMATRLAEEMKQRFGGETRTFADGTVPAFRLDLAGGKSSGWVLIAHPLWDWHDSEELAPDTVLANAEEEASEEGSVDCWDTFNLTRRPVQVREWIRDSTE
jgi:DEAD/DEAH box helicase domain-containing protein